MSAKLPDASVLALRHPKVQRLRRLLSRRSVRDAERVFVVEGAKVLTEALDGGARVESVYLASGTSSALVERASDAGADVYEFAPGVIERVSDTVTPQPVMAVVTFVDRPRHALGDTGVVVVGVDIRDPGNAGTVLRSAEAAGACGVVLCEGSVDAYNPKTVRASAGSLFHVPLALGGSPRDVLDDLGRRGFHRLATAATGGTDYTEIDLTRPVALVLGNEANGLPPEIDDLVDQRVTIPMVGRSESLNVGMAAAVLCFEAARQRRREVVAT